MAFIDFCISDASDQELAAKLVLEGVIMPTMDQGYQPVGGVLFSYIGPAEHPDTKQTIPGVCAFVGLDTGQLGEKAQAISTALDAQKVDSVTPLRERANVKGGTKDEEAGGVALTPA